MILSIGEILIDSFVTSNKEDNKAGGAPFNVACDIKKYGGDVSFYGVVGNDNDGDYLISFARKIIGDNAFIFKRNNAKTTRAVVTNQNGERSFKFERENGSDYLFDKKDLNAIEIEKYNIINIGTLMISKDSGYHFALDLIKYIRNNTKSLIAIDVNYRDDVFSQKETAISRYKEIIKYADILKLSEDEIPIIVGEDVILDNLNERLNYAFAQNQSIFISLGEKGCAFYRNGKTIFAPTIKVDVVDTCGAGDAFYAYLINAIDKKLYDLNEDSDIKIMLSKANIAGALTTRAKGAIDPVPTFDDIEIEARTNG